MTVLLEIKENLKVIYAKYAVAVNVLIRFGLALISLCMLNFNLGYNSRIANPFVTAGIALVCAAMPYGICGMILAMVMLSHIFAVSMELAILTAVFLVIVVLLYCSFQPGDSYWLILTPLAFMLHIPFVIPLLAGLASSLVCIIPVSCGVVIFYIIQYVKQNAGVLANDASVDIAQKYILLIRALMSNREMVIFIAVCVVGIVIVYLIRRLPMDYSWTLAVALGLVGQLAVVFAGDFAFDVSIPILDLLLGMAGGLIIAEGYHFFVYAVDYTRTEFTEFEDDDYVYYVKAVPKLAVSKSDVKVQRINNPRKIARQTREK